MGFTEDQKAAFREDGFVNLGQVLKSTDLVRIGTEYDRLVVAEKQTLGNDRDGRYPYRAMLNFRSDDLRSFITHPALVSLGIDLLGPDVRFWWDQGINKQPGSGSHIDWHQDNGYHRGRIPEYLTLWLALDDSDTANGGLLVLPGSHAQGPRAHELADVHWVIPDIDESGAISLEAKAGDLLAFSSFLIHKTVGNHTKDRQRRAWVIQYVRAD
ncbi:MAG: phytanoyl-CoA dioxygenase family protein, partial [bacterium]